MGFESVEIELCESFEALDLVREYDKIKTAYRELGVDHGNTLVAQISGHTECDFKFFLTGRVLNNEESEKFAAMLKSEGCEAEEHF